MWEDEYTSQIKYMDIESLGVQHLQIAISRTDYLVENIKNKDRGPSWDGYIEVYKKPGNNHKNEDLIRDVPVQVKCRICNDLDKDSIGYSVEVSDLRNYLNAGGTVFIVVYVSDDGEKYSIYSNRLLPFELKQIIEAKKTGTKTIRLARIPDDRNELASFFIAFARDMLQQAAAINADPISLDEFVSQYPDNELSVSFTQLPNNRDALDIPFRHLFDQDAYLYGTIGHGIKLPLQHIEKIEAAGTVTYKLVNVGDKTYYTQYQEVYTELYKEFIIGKSIHFRFTYLGNKQKFSFALSGNLDERIADISFILDAFDHKAFSVGGIEIGLAENEYSNAETLEKIGRLKEFRSYYKDINKALRALKVKSELDIGSMKLADHVNMGMLIDAFVYKKPIPVKNPNCMIGTFTVANLELLVWSVKERDSDLCYLFNFTDNPYQLICRGDNGEEFDSNVVVTLDEDSIHKYSNLDYRRIIKQLDEVPLSEAFDNQLNNFLLHILCAYDQSKEKELLTFAEGVLGVLRKGSLKNTSLLILNELQTIFRKRPLKTREIKRIKSILESKDVPKDVAAGAYILLRNKNEANEIINSMPLEIANTFKEYPIYHLL